MSDRSDAMSRIRGKNTKPEVLLRKSLWARGLRYRLHRATPAGRPDIVFPGPRVAIFVDGCFWHGCPAHYVPPRSREAFWARKLKTNVERDQRQTRELERSGWRVMRVWEHEVESNVSAITLRIGSMVQCIAHTSHVTSWRVVRAEANLFRGSQWILLGLETLRDPIRRTVKSRRRGGGYLVS